ncbi:MAG: hypothetical protein IJ452_02295 [Butyricicoccus sp.]|nr:hypothetical protein [Butyricicoccus sp.]
MKQNIRAAVRSVLTFGAVLAALWLLLVLCAHIPNAAIREHMLQSAETYAQRDAYEFTRKDRLNTVADHYADAIWLGVAWNMGAGDPLTGSVATAYYDGEALGVNAGLYAAVTEGAPPNTDYTRYWHGTAGIIRMLLLFTDVEGIKTIGFAAFLALAALSVLLLIRLRHADLAALLLLSLAAVQVWTIRLSMEYQPAFLIAFALLPLYICLERQGDRRLTTLSIIGGTAAAFFDFLTTETVTVLLPLAVVIAVRAKEDRLGTFRQALPMVIRCGAGWGLSYAGAFLVKWAAAGLVTGADAVSAAVGSVGERLGGDLTGFTEQPGSFLSALLANLNMPFGSAYRVESGRLLLGCGLFVLVLLSVWYLLRRRGTRADGAFLLLAVGAVVFVRFLVLNNHSYLHCFFTYRALVTPVFAMLAALRLHIALPQKKGKRR